MSLSIPKLAPRVAVRELCRADKVLARLIRKIGPLRLKPKRDQEPFEALFRSIIYQQLAGKAAATIHGRALALFPGLDHPSPEDVLRTDEATWRSAGLSRGKTRAIQDLARRTLDGTVPSGAEIERLPDDEIIERLTSIHGVGPWTVQMMLIFKLGRPDVLPITDLGVQKGFAIAYGLKELPTPKELLAHGEKWKPHRTAAAWYLWRACD